jgi:hypothetical protein
MDEAASAASLNLNDQDYIELMKCASMWFNEHKELLEVTVNYSDITTEQSLSDDDDGYHYRPEQPNASFLTEDSDEQNIC